MLQTQEALLLDVRTEAARVASGTAELRRGALGKGAAVPPVRVRGAAGRDGEREAGRAPPACSDPHASTHAAISPLHPSPGSRGPSRTCTHPPLRPPCPLQLLPSVERRVRDPAAVALEIQALSAASLSKVRPRATKVIIMDERVS